MIRNPNLLTLVNCFDYDPVEPELESLSFFFNNNTTQLLFLSFPTSFILFLFQEKYRFWEIYAKHLFRFSSVCNHHLLISRSNIVVFLSPQNYFCSLIIFHYCRSELKWNTMSKLIKWYHFTPGLLARFIAFQSCLDLLIISFIHVVFSDSSQKGLGFLGQDRSFSNREGASPFLFSTKGGKFLFFVSIFTGEVLSVIEWWRKKDELLPRRGDRAHLRLRDEAAGPKRGVVGVQIMV